jgi:bacterioferritin-associated ferredoxin
MNPKRAIKGDEVIVGPKDSNAYLATALICLSNHGKVRIEGLGRQCGKVLGVARALVELKRARIVNVESFELDGIHGVRVSLEEVNEL